MNRLAAETSPYLLQHAENPVDWYPWGPEALERARSEERPILLSVGYSACHWCHVMAHESFESDGDGGADERALRQRQGRPRGAARRRRALHGRDRLDDRAGRLADDRLPHAGGRAVLRRHLLPARAAARPAVASRSSCSRWPRPGTTQRDDIVTQARRLVEAASHSARIEPSAEPLTAALLDEAERGIARTFEPAYGGFGRAPKFPPASTLEFLLRRGSPEAMEMVTKTLDGMAAGGHVRPRRRRLPPLLGRRALARAALREDALRQRAARLHLPARIRRHGRAAVSRDRRGDARLRGPRAAAARAAASPRRRTPTRTASRASRSPGPRTKACRRSCCSPSSTAARSSAARSTPSCAPGCSPSVSSRPQPGLDDKVLASWNGLALAALAEGARRLERADWLDAARGVGEFLLGPLSREDGRLSRSWREGKVSGEGFLDDYANVGARPARAPPRDRRAALPDGGAPARAARRRAVPRSRARRLLPRADGRRGARGPHEGARRQPDPLRQLDARARAAAARPDLGRRRARAPRRVGAAARGADAQPRARGLRLDALRARPLARRRRARSRSSGRSTAPSPARRWRRSRRTRSSRSGRPTACRCSRARASSTASRPSTSASDSPVRRP